MSNTAFEQLRKRYQAMVDRAVAQDVSARTLLIQFRAANYQLFEPTSDAFVGLSERLALSNAAHVAMAHQWLNSRGVPSIIGGVEVDTDIGQVDDIRAVTHDTADRRHQYKDIKGDPPIKFSEHKRLSRRIEAALQASPVLIEAFRGESTWHAVLEIKGDMVRVLEPGELQIRINPAFFIIDEIHRNLDDIGVPTLHADDHAGDTLPKPDVVHLNEDAFTAQHQRLGALAVTPNNVGFADVHKALRDIRESMIASHKANMLALDEMEKRICVAVGALDPDTPSTDTTSVYAFVVDSATGRRWWWVDEDFLTTPVETTLSDTSKLTRYLGEQIWPFDNTAGWVVIVESLNQSTVIELYMSGRDDPTEVAEITTLAAGTSGDGVRCYVYAIDESAERMEWIGQEYGDDEASMSTDHKAAAYFPTTRDSDFDNMANTLLELAKSGQRFFYIYTKDWV